jgi:hypothetical protein
VIIWLASYPRSGNTFFRLLLKQMYGLHSEAPVDQLWNPEAVTVQEPVAVSTAGTGEMDDRFGMTSRRAASLEALISAPEHYIVKTHDLPQDDFPAIYLVRDGRDALVSHAHFVVNYDLGLLPEEAERRFPEVLRMLIETDVSFGGWTANIKAWTGRSAPTALVRFQDLIASPLNAVRQAMHEIGLFLPEQEAFDLWTFEQLHAEFPQFFRKGQQGAWREEMPYDLQLLFWKRHGDTMRMLGYTDGQVA